MSAEKRLPCTSIFGISLPELIPSGSLN